MAESDGGSQAESDEAGRAAAVQAVSAGAKVAAMTVFVESCDWVAGQHDPIRLPGSVAVNRQAPGSVHKTNLNTTLVSMLSIPSRLCCVDRISSDHAWGPSAN